MTTKPPAGEDHIQNNILDKEMIHVQGRTGQDNERFYHAIQNDL